MNVILDGGERNTEGAGHLPVRFTECDAGGHFVFPTGQQAKPAIAAASDHGHNPVVASSDANIVPAAVKGGNLGGREALTDDQSVDEAVDGTVVELHPLTLLHDHHRSGGQPVDHDQLIAEYFAAMRIGAEAEEQMMALFNDDAVYSDPFGDTDEPAVGAEAIRDRFRAGWSFNPPDLELEVLRVDVDGDQASSSWECRSEAFPGPMRGHDTYRFRDGRIAELHVTLDQPD